VSNVVPTQTLESNKLISSLIVLVRYFTTAEGNLPTALGSIIGQAGIGNCRFPAGFDALVVVLVEHVIDRSVSGSIPGTLHSLHDK
jgi:hypothetical protein